MKNTAYYKTAFAKSEAASPYNLNKTPMRAMKEDSSMKAMDKTSMKAMDKTSMKAMDKTSMKAMDKSSMKAMDKTSMKMAGKTHMYHHGDSDNATVKETNPSTGRKHYHAAKTESQLNK
tara:strand:+ start:230 stop:586 length:357 start_codon:yes stop_codon:yes gene_type:complete